MTTVLHVTRAFSAQPTLGECLDGATVVESPLAEALVGSLLPTAVWVSGALPADVEAVRARFGGVPVLATPSRRASTADLVGLIRAADLVLPDEGVLLAAAGLLALIRRAPAASVG